MKRKVIFRFAIAFIFTVLLAMTPWKTTTAHAAAPNFESTLVYGSGSDDDKAVITIMGDGYTANQQDSFIATAKKIASTIAEQYPYSQFKDRLNIRAIKVVSNVSGLNQNTYFQSTFQKHYIAPSGTGFQRIRELGAAYTPRAAARVLVSNTDSYSAVAWKTEQLLVIGAPATMFVTHELAHALGQLADEYTNAGNYQENPNASKNGDPATVRWKNFIGIKNVSVGKRNNWYYPSINGRDCIMSSGLDFCPVCSAAITERLADSAGILFYGTLFNGTYDPKFQKPLNAQAEIKIPEGTDRILDFAFHGLEQLKTVTIPASVKTIGEYAFLKDTKLTTIYNMAVNAQNIKSGADRFYGVNRANITLYVPAGSKQTYLNAGWTGFKEIREDGNTVATPETNAELPILASQPADSTVKLGEAARLSVSANVSKGKLSYQWYETSSQSNGTTNLIAGATSASYQPNTSAAGTKYYFAIVTNTDLSATGQKIAQVKTRFAAVMVKENAVTNAQTPVISSQPSDVTVKQNENAQLTVTADVTKGQLSYQWYESASSNNSNGAAIKNAVNASYQPNTSAAGKKYYYVTVTNTDASATGSKSAQTVSRAAMVTTNSNTSSHPEDTWLPNRPYTGGQTVIYNGLKYRAKWWTTARPDTGDAWELLSTNGSTEYVPGRVYVQGDEATYKGQTWRAKWWTKSVPGSDNSWELK